MLKTIASLLFFLVLAASNLNCRAQDSKHVILITIDGFAAYHLENENLLLPNIRELAKDGVWAKGAMTTYPSVTHPAHATLVTGVSPRKHGLLSNTMTNRETNKTFETAILTRKEAIRVPTLFDVAHAAGLKVAALDWPETRQDPSIDINLVHGHDDLYKEEVDPKLLQRLKDAGVPMDAYYAMVPYGRMGYGFRDFVLAMAAAEIIRTDRPNLMAIHFSIPDGMQHTYGPDHYYSLASLSQTDYLIGLMRKAVEEAGLKDRTTFVIAADHGFHTATDRVNIYPLLEKNGLVGKVVVNGRGWNAFLEKTEKFTKRDNAALESFLKDLLKLDGIHRVIRNEDFPELGFPRYEENPHVRGQFVIIPEIDAYISVDEQVTSTERQPRPPYHSHGYLPNHPRMHSSLVFSGYQIKKGERIGLVRNLDVAPTIANILGISLPDVEGRVLNEALAK